MKKIKALIITGDGLNCENETALAFRQQGFIDNIVHIQDLIHAPQILKDYQVLAIPGGFSFGDEISSGQVLALKIKHHLAQDLIQFIEDKKLIIGICNGFQTLIKLGLLPHPLKERTTTLTHNIQNQFINKWVDVYFNESICHWTKSLQNQTISLPIRHGEGRVVFSGDSVEQNLSYQNLKLNRQIALEYTEEVNGSYQKIAGLTDPSGCILGLMPHPEAATTKLLLPGGADKKDESYFGAFLFQNAMNYCLEKLSKD